MSTVKEQIVIESTIPSPLLWKEIWWIKSTVLLLICFCCYICYKATVSIVTRCLGSRRQRLHPNREASSSLPSSETVPPGSNFNKTGNEFPKHDFDVPSSAYVVGEKIKPKDDKEMYYDLAHHGIQFYDDNMYSNRERRPRMHSTVAEATLVSMVRHRQQHPGLTVVRPPAFPKLKNVFDDSKVKMTAASAANKHPIQNNVRDFSFESGDMKHVQLKSRNSRLSTVTEEDMDLSERDSLCHTSIQSKHLDTTNRNEQSTHPANQRGNAYSLMDSEVIGYTEKLVKLSGDHNRSSRNVETVTSCPSLINDKCSKNFPSSNTFECFNCKSQIHCLCNSCSSGCPPIDSKKGSISSCYEDGTNADCGNDEIHDGFIDENFEDMESIVSEEVTDT